MYVISIFVCEFNAIWLSFSHPFCRFAQNVATDTAIGSNRLDSGPNFPRPIFPNTHLARKEIESRKSVRGYSNKVSVCEVDVYNCTVMISHEWNTQLHRWHEGRLQQMWVIKTNIDVGNKQNEYVYIVYACGVVFFIFCYMLIQPYFPQ